MPMIEISAFLNSMESMVILRQRLFEWLSVLSGSVVRSDVRQASYITYLVLIPVCPETKIDAGSGIVGLYDGDSLRVYFEGGGHQQNPPMSFEDKLLHAAGRMFASYPTVAYGYFQPASFHIVGSYEFSVDFKKRTLHVFDQQALTAWVGLAVS